ncbi:MAG TPA: EVE domain-containing protein [Candidatus Limnocylindrales bacterium]|nr:EVE domain-containing protein [Candidatus Limnocylindrales bacterium]
MENTSNPFHSYWIFQFNPEVYDWFGWMKENRASEQWLVTRFAKLISVEDKVAIWASGKDSGIYALGETVTYPLKNPLNPEQVKYYKSSRNVDKFIVKPSVSVKYLKTFLDNPISKNRCKEDCVLSSLGILSDFTNATNFKVSKSQWNKILEFVL